MAAKAGVLTAGNRLDDDAPVSVWLAERDLGQRWSDEKVLFLNHPKAVGDLGIELADILVLQFIRGRAEHLELWGRRRPEVGAGRGRQAHALWQLEHHEAVESRVVERKEVEGERIVTRLAGDVRPAEARTQLR